VDYENNVLLQLVNSTISDVSIKENLGYDAVEGIIARYIGKEVDWNSVDNLEVLGLDDLSRKKGRKDLAAIVSTRVAGKTRVLAVLTDRKKATVKEFLQNIPKRSVQICVTVLSMRLRMFLSVG
jgi:transposase